MIKAAGLLNGGTPFIALGISAENWSRLRAGQPITVTLRSVSSQLPDLLVVLLGGDTEESLCEDLRSVGMI